MKKRIIFLVSVILIIVATLFLSNFSGLKGFFVYEPAFDDTDLSDVSGYVDIRESIKEMVEYYGDEESLDNILSEADYVKTAENAKIVSIDQEKPLIIDERAINEKRETDLLIAEYEKNKKTFDLVIVDPNTMFVLDAVVSLQYINEPIISGINVTTGKLPDLRKEGLQNITVTHPDYKTFSKTFDQPPNGIFVVSLEQENATALPSLYFANDVFSSMEFDRVKDPGKKPVIDSEKTRYTTPELHVYDGTQYYDEEAQKKIVCDTNGRCERKIYGVAKDAYNVPIENVLVLLAAGNKVYFDRTDEAGKYEIWVPAKTYDRDLQQIIFLHPYFNPRSYADCFAPCSDSCLNHVNQSKLFNFKKPTAIDNGKLDMVDASFNKCAVIAINEKYPRLWKQVNPNINVVLSEKENVLMRSGKQIKRLTKEPYTEPGSIGFNFEITHCDDLKTLTPNVYPNSEGYFRQIMEFDSKKDLYDYLVNISLLKFGNFEINANDPWYASPHNRMFLRDYCLDTNSSAEDRYLKTGHHHEIKPPVKSDDYDIALISQKSLANELKQNSLQIFYTDKIYTDKISENPKPKDLGKIGINTSLNQNQVLAHPFLILNSWENFYWIFVRPYYPFIFNNLTNKPNIHYAYNIEEICGLGAVGCADIKYVFMEAVNYNGDFLGNLQSILNEGIFVHELTHVVNANLNVKSPMKLPTNISYSLDEIIQLKKNVFNGPYTHDYDNFFKLSDRDDFVSQYAQVNESEDLAVSAEVFWAQPYIWTKKLGLDATQLNKINFKKINTPELNFNIGDSKKQKLLMKFVFVKDILFGGSMRVGDNIEKR